VSAEKGKGKKNKEQTDKGGGWEVPFFLNKKKPTVEKDTAVLLFLLAFSSFPPPLPSFPHGPFGLMAILLCSPLYSSFFFIAPM
jgi:hypothetical protein